MIELNKLEGYRPLAEVDITDNHYLRKGVASDSEATVAYYPGFSLDPETIAMLSLRGRQQLQEEQGFHPAVNVLLGQINRVLPPGGMISMKGLTYTALTNLFQEAHGVSLGKLTRGYTNALAITCSVTEYEFSMNYGVRRPDRHEPTRDFWQLRGNGPYGFVNMVCLKPPLKGAGSVALIPGVLEALAEDAQTVLGMQPDLNDF